MDTKPRPLIFCSALFVIGVALIVAGANAFDEVAMIIHFGYTCVFLGWTGVLAFFYLKRYRIHTAGGWLSYGEKGYRFAYGVLFFFVTLAYFVMMVHDLPLN